MDFLWFITYWQWSCRVEGRQTALPSPGCPPAPAYVPLESQPLPLKSRRGCVTVTSRHRGSLIISPLMWISPSVLSLSACLQSLHSHFAQAGILDLATLLFFSYCDHTSSWSHDFKIALGGLQSLHIFGPAIYLLFKYLTPLPVCKNTRIWDGECLLVLFSGLSTEYNVWNASYIVVCDWISSGNTKEAFGSWSRSWITLEYTKSITHCWAKSCCDLCLHCRMGP